MRFSAAFTALVIGSVLAVGPIEQAEATTPTATGVCSVGVQLQKRLVIGSLSPQYGARLTGETTCFFFVTWDLAKGIYSTGATVDFFHPNTSGYFSYSGEPATVHAVPRQGASSLTQYTDAQGQKKYFEVVESGSNTMTAKYDSRIAWHRVNRTGGTATLTASVARYSRSATMFGGGYVAWPGARVRFQLKTASGWTTAATVTANRTGIATAHLRRGVHTWRAVSADSRTTWGRATQSHRG